MPFPDSVDGYTVQELIGRGGHGRVYRVADADGNLRAIKTYRDHDMTPMDEQRFVREFNVASGLVHANIVQVFGWGTVSGTPYFSMEYITGGHLRDYVAARGAGPHWLVDPTLREQFFSIVSGVLSGLAYIHAHRIVHRDMKPENILLTEQHVPKIMDFGLARNLESSVRLTTENTLLGTVAYMSPEQVASSEIDPRSDLYSLGVIIFEWIMARLPYDANDIGGLLGKILMTPSPLMHDLDAAVSEPLSKFVARLLEKDPGLRPATADDALEGWHRACQGLADSARQPTPPPTLPVVPSLFEPVFVGREQEMAVLLAGLDRITQGEASIVVVAGESGVGKSRMALELARAAALRGIPAVGVRCYEDVDVPFGAFLPLLRRLVRDPLTPEMGTFIENARPVFAAVLPELVEDGDLPQPEAGERYRFFQTVLQLFDMVRRDRCVVILFDDLQWADARSLELLGYLTRELLQKTRDRGKHLFDMEFVMLYREDELRDDHPFASFLQTLDGSRFVSFVRLQRLTVEATERMAVSMLGGRPLPPHLLDLLVREAEGNAFFISEFLKALLQDQILTLKQGDWHLEAQAMFRWGPRVDSGGVPVPITIRDVIRRRLRRLPHTAWDTLRIASVLGRDIPYDLLARCSTLSEEDLLLSLEVLLNEKILQEQRHRHSLSFYHPQIREVVLEDMPDARRRSLHLRAARSLEEYAGTDFYRYLFELAHHFSQGRELHQAAHYMMLAADQAKASYGFDEAIATLKQLETMATEEGGLDPSILLDIRRRLAHVTLLSGDFKTAVRMYTALESQVKGTARAEMLRNLGRAWDFLGEHDQAYGCYSKVLDVLGEKIQVNRIHTLLAGIKRFSRPDGAGRKALSPQETDRLREVRKVCDLMVQSYYFARQEDRRMMGTELAIRHLEVSLQLGQAQDIAQAYLTAGFMLLQIGTHKDWQVLAPLATDTRAQLRRWGRSYLSRTLQCADDMPESPLRARILREVGFTYLGIGEVKLAVPLMEAAFAMCKKVNDVLGIPASATIVSMMHHLQGDMPRAREEVEFGLARAISVQNATMTFFLMLRMVRLELTAGNVAAAHDWVSQARRAALASWAPQSLQRLRLQASEAELLRVEGALEQSVILQEQNRQAYRETGMSLFDMMTVHVDAGMTWLDWLEAGGPAEECLSRCEAIVRDTKVLAEGPLLKAQALMLLGRLRAVQGRREEARLRLSRSLQLLTECGSNTLLVRCLVEAGRCLSDATWLQQGRDLAAQIGFTSMVLRADGVSNAAGVCS